MRLFQSPMCHTAHSFYLYDINNQSIFRSFSLTQSKAALMIIKLASTRYHLGSEFCPAIRAVYVLGV